MVRISPYLEERMIPHRATGAVVDGSGAHNLTFESVMGAATNVSVL